MDTIYTLDDRTYVIADNLQAILETDEDEVIEPGHVPLITDQCVLNNCIHLVKLQYISLHPYTKGIFEDFLFNNSGFTLSSWIKPISSLMDIHLFGFIYYPNFMLWQYVSILTVESGVQISVRCSRFMLNETTKEYNIYYIRYYKEDAKVHGMFKPGDKWIHIAFSCPAHLRSNHAKLMLQGKPYKLSVKGSGHYGNMERILHARIGSIFYESFIIDEVFIWKSVVPNNPIRKLYLSHKHGHV